MIVTVLAPLYVSVVASGSARVRRACSTVSSACGALSPELGMVTVSLAFLPLPTPPVLKSSLLQSDVLPLSVPWPPLPFASKPVPPFGVAPSQLQSTGDNAACVKTLRVVLPAASLVRHEYVVP